MKVRALLCHASFTYLVRGEKVWNTVTWQITFFPITREITAKLKISFYQIKLHLFLHLLYKFGAFNGILRSPHLGKSIWLAVCQECRSLGWHRVIGHSALCYSAWFRLRSLGFVRFRESRQLSASDRLDVTNFTPFYYDVHEMRNILQIFYSKRHE